MSTYNSIIKKRNAGNTDWDTILPVTTAENVMVNETYSVKDMIGSLSSYMAFCGNVNTASLDAAFGEGNEDVLHSIGYNLALYIKKSDPNMTMADLAPLIACGTLDEIITTPAAVAQALAALPLIQASPYANGKFPAMSEIITAAEIPSLKQNYVFLSGAMKNTAVIDFIRTTPELKAAWNANRVPLITLGNSTWTVPAGKSVITVESVGLGYGRGCGKHQVDVFKVTPGEIFNVTLGRQGYAGIDEVTRFGNVARGNLVNILAGQGEFAIGKIVDRQIGAFLTAANDGGYDTGSSGYQGVGGWGGGNGGRSDVAAGGTGPNELGDSPNSGGTGYEQGTNGGGGGGNCTASGRNAASGGGGFGGGGGSGPYDKTTAGLGGMGCIVIYL